MRSGTGADGRSRLDREVRRVRRIAVAVCPLLELRSACSRRSRCLGLTCPRSVAIHSSKSFRSPRVRAAAAAAAAAAATQCGSPRRAPPSIRPLLRPTDARGGWRGGLCRCHLGCLGACTYCKTKHARGHLGSYEPDAIVARAKRVACEEGVKEIWLSSEDTGQ